MDLVVIQQKIYEIRGQKVMLDFDLAQLYEVMFELTREEYNEILRSQIVTLRLGGRGAHSKYNPYAFTEHGVTMLASILKSEKAVEMNIFVVRAFIALRQFALNYKELADEIQEIRRTVDNHSEQLGKIYAAIEALLTEKEIQKTWTERERIGFK